MDMNAPTPYNFDSNKNNVEDKPTISIKKKYQIISNNNIKYNIIFEIISSKLSITAYPENSNIKYKQSFTLKDIQKVKLFVAFDNLEECLDEIFEGLDMNKNVINE